MYLVLETYTDCLPETPTCTFPDYDSAVMGLSSLARNAREFIDLHVEGGDPSGGEIVDGGAKVYAEMEHLARQPFWSGKVVRLDAAVTLLFD